MKASEAAETVAYIEAAWGKSFSDETRAVWVDHLSELDANACRAAVRKLAQTSQWLPSIAEIREATRHVLNPRAYFGVHGGPALPSGRKEDSVPMPPELKARWNAVLEKIGKEKEARAKAVEQMPEPEPRRKMRPDLYCQGTGKMAVNGKCPDCGAVGELSPPEWFAPMVEHD